MVSASEIEAITDRMAKLVGNQKRSETQRLQAWERLFHKLTLTLPPKLSPLPSFEIVDG